MVGIMCSWFLYQSPSSSFLSKWDLAISAANVNGRKGEETVTREEGEERILSRLEEFFHHSIHLRP